MQSDFYPTVNLEYGGKSRFLLFIEVMLIATQFRWTQDIPIPRVTGKCSVLP